MADTMTEEARSELQGLKRREKIQLILALVMTVGEYIACVMLYVHEHDWISGYLAVTYLCRETRGGDKYRAAMVRGIVAPVVNVVRVARAKRPEKKVEDES